MWPFRSKRALIRDTAILDQLLADPQVLASVETFNTMVFLEGGEPGPDALIDLAVAQGLDRDAALLLVALAARLEGAS
jgi:hypothetical protein